MTVGDDLAIYYVDLGAPESGSPAAMTAKRNLQHLGQPDIYLYMTRAFVCGECLRYADH
jgi:hypothetical protein